MYRNAVAKSMMIEGTPFVLLTILLLLCILYMLSHTEYSAQLNYLLAFLNVGPVSMKLVQTFFFCSYFILLSHDAVITYGNYVHL